MFRFVTTNPFFWAAYTAEDSIALDTTEIQDFWAAYTAEDYGQRQGVGFWFFWAAYTAEDSRAKL